MSGPVIAPRRRDSQSVTSLRSKDLLGIAELAAGRDLAHSRHRRGDEGDRVAADQEGARAAWQDGRQSVFRGEHADAHLVRDSREAAECRHAQCIASASSSVVKGETLVDTALNIEAMQPDMIVLRHPSSGAGHLLSRLCRSAIITAGDGMHEHPTQALLDAFTIRERKKQLADLKVAIVGDLFHSRVLRSNVQLLTKMGADVWVCGPPTLIPTDITRFGVHATSAIDEAVADADVIMLLRIQLERMEGAFFPSLREYCQRVWHDRGTPSPGEAGRDRHAPRTDEPRCRDRVGGRRWPLLGDS